jgi:hypothetical protein
MTLIGTNLVCAYFFVACPFDYVYMFVCVLRLCVPYLLMHFFYEGPESFMRTREVLCSQIQLILLWGPHIGLNGLTIP